MDTVATRRKRKMNTYLAAQEKAVVLVIDDDQDTVAGLAKVLSSAGYACQCCRDADAAAESVRQSAPDLIISDVNLHGHSGLQLCQQLKREEGLFETPLMFLSGSQVPDIIRRSHDAGTYYLRKPFDPQVLLELVDNALWMSQDVAV